MKEIEILVKLNEDIKSAIKKINNLQNINFVGEKHTIDIYYIDPLRKDLNPVEGNSFRNCFRLRKKDNKNYLTYKINRFDENDVWEYSDEFETEVKDYEEIKKIIELLHLKELIRVDNIKHTFTTQNYEIVVEDVKNLGYFLEVEKLNCPDNCNIQEEKTKIKEFIKSLNLNVSEEIDLGKPEMMLELKK